MLSATSYGHLPDLQPVIAPFTIHGSFRQQYTCIMRLCTKKGTDDVQSTVVVGNKEVHARRKTRQSFEVGPILFGRVRNVLPLHSAPCYSSPHGTLFTDGRLYWRASCPCIKADASTCTDAYLIWYANIVCTPLWSLLCAGGPGAVRRIEQPVESGGHCGHG